MALYNVGKMDLTDEVKALMLGDFVKDPAYIITPEDNAWMAAYEAATLKGTGLHEKSEPEAAATVLAAKKGWTKRTASAIWAAFKAFWVYIGQSLKIGFMKIFAKKIQYTTYVAKVQAERSVKADAKVVKATAAKAVKSAAKAEPVKVGADNVKVAA